MSLRCCIDYDVMVQDEEHQLMAITVCRPTRVYWMVYVHMSPDLKAL